MIHDDRITRREALAQVALLLGTAISTPTLAAALDAGAGDAWRSPLGWVPRTLSPDQRGPPRSEEHTSELQSQSNLVCRLLLEKKKKEHITKAFTLRIPEDYHRADDDDPANPR